MGKTLEVTLRTLDNKVKYAAVAGENAEIAVDYYPPIGSGEGYTSLELLLISFSTCISTAVLSLLRSMMRKSVESLSATASGTQRDDHPKTLADINVVLTIRSQDVTREDVDKSLALSEDKICPVWALLKGNVAVNVSYVIER